MSWKRAVLYGGVAGLLIGVAVAFVPLSQTYTSTAVIQVAPSMVPERFVPAATAVDVRSDLIPVWQTFTTRSSLSRIIETFSLYSRERSEMPLEDVIERMRRAMSFSVVEPNNVRISFTYHDPAIAQRITAHIAALVIGAHRGFRVLQADSTVRFMKDMAIPAASEWETSVARLQSAEKAGQVTDRLRLDVDIARERYRTLSARIAEAEMFQDLEKRQQGAKLELLDPASLPGVSRPPVWKWPLAGAGAGVVLGLLVSVLPRFPRRLVFLPRHV